MLLSRLILGTVGLSLAAAAAYSQSYPSKPVRIITSGVGGGNDFVARLIAQGLAAPLGQQVVVDNRGGITGVEVVAKAPPDGYTIMVQGETFTHLPLIEKLPWDPLRDFAPI